jgi:hypothetical protein
MGNKSLSNNLTSSLRVWSVIGDYRPEGIDGTEFRLRTGHNNST